MNTKRDREKGLKTNTMNEKNTQTTKKRSRPTKNQLPNENPLQVNEN